MFSLPARNAREDEDENPNSNLVAETKNLLADRSCGYQIMNRNPHTVTKYLNGEKRHGAINDKFFDFVGYIDNQLNGVQLVKSEKEHKEPNFVGFFQQHAKLTILGLYYAFFSSMR